ncbi:hypothetical protein AB0H77_31285 [Streptomyces sp. NPDC050844]|uniref:hypothetical protein n=1 Tax=Streptomyces sp. NPDC050844 TaxID=3155790 RepID=UPI0033C146FF
MPNSKYYLYGALGLLVGTAIFSVESSLRRLRNIGKEEPVVTRANAVCMGAVMGLSSGFGLLGYNQGWLPINLALAPTLIAWMIGCAYIVRRRVKEQEEVVVTDYGPDWLVVGDVVYLINEGAAKRAGITSDPKIAQIRKEYGSAVTVDPSGYQERLGEAEAELAQVEATSGIETISEMLGAARTQLDPTSPEARQAMAYTASSVLDVFRLIGPPPPGVSDPPDDGGGDIPDSGAGVPRGGRRG